MHMDMGVSELLCNRRARVIFLLLLMPLPTVLCWGKEGHYAICKITQEYLTEDALFAVKKLLPDSLLKVILLQFALGLMRLGIVTIFVGVVLYIMLTRRITDVTMITACHDSYGHKHRCVTGAIYNYTIQLKSADLDTSSDLKYNLTEALMFLSHFVGDVHQPLHVGFTGDLGGNSITVRWYRRKTNLHHVWDDMIIESALKTFYGSDLSIMIQAIERNITDIWSTDVSIWEHCAHNYTASPDRYASESISLACKFAYKNATPGSTLEDEYFLSRLPIVEKRLAQGGVRLAAILNRIFTPKIRIAQA